MASPQGGGCARLFLTTLCAVGGGLTPFLMLLWEEAVEDESEAWAPSRSPSHAPEGVPRHKWCGCMQRTTSHCRGTASSHPARGPAKGLLDRGLGHPGAAKEILTDFGVQSLCFPIPGHVPFLPHTWACPVTTTHLGTTALLEIGQRSSPSA